MNQTVSVGRIAHFHDGKGSDPLPAIAIGANEDGTFEFQVFGRNGARFAVALPLKPLEPNPKGYFWDWPPRV